MMIVISVCTVYVVFLFQRRKSRLLKQQLDLKESYEREILKTQIEIRDQTMNDVGKELHDHISQVMALIKLNLNLMQGDGLGSSDKSRLTDARALMEEVVSDIRMLSKTLNGDLISKVGLIAGIRNELERVNRLKIINCRLEVVGPEYEIPPKKAFVVFRIIQENLHNILKHAQCKNVLTTITYAPSEIILMQKDDGVGFDFSDVSQGAGGNGLVNMRRRAAMINAGLEFETAIGKGTMLNLKIIKD